jgi:hypothetical protein
MTSLDTRERRRGGLVGVDTDGQLARSLGGGEDAATGATGGVVDHVGAVLVHALGGGLALVDRAEARRSPAAG